MYISSVVDLRNKIDEVEEKMSERRWMGGWACVIFTYTHVHVHVHVQYM